MQLHDYVQKVRQLFCPTKLNSGQQAGAIQSAEMRTADSYNMCQYAHTSCSLVDDVGA